MTSAYNVLKSIGRFIWKVIKWYLVLSIASVIIFRFVPPPFTPLMIMRFGEQLFSSKKKVKLSKDWTSLEHISAVMPLAVIAAEDQKFEEHFGFDFEAINKARRYNDRHKGKRVKGASTISQQTA